MQTTIKAASGRPSTRPTVFQNPAMGFPSRTESTSMRGMLIRQLSHSGGRVNGTAETVSAVTTSACHCVARPPRQS